MNTVLEIETIFPMNNTEARALALMMFGMGQFRSYRPSTINWTGDPSVQPGDVITTVAPNGETITHIVTSQTLHFGGGFRIESRCTDAG